MIASLVPGDAVVGERDSDRAVVNVGFVVNPSWVPRSQLVGSGLCSLPLVTGNVGCWPQLRWSVAEVALIEAVLARSRREPGARPVGRVEFRRRGAFMDPG